MKSVCMPMNMKKLKNYFLHKSVLCPTLKCYSLLALSKLGIEGKILSLIKSVYKKPITKILNSERLNAFPMSSETWQGCTLTTLFNVVLKGIRIRKEEVKPSQFAEDMIAYNEKSEGIQRKIPRTNNKFSKITKYKITKKSIAFLYINRCVETNLKQYYL